MMLSLEDSFLCSVWILVTEEVSPRLSTSRVNSVLVMMPSKGIGLPLLVELSVAASQLVMTCPNALCRS